MKLMQAFGVRRALVEVRGVWRHGGLRDATPTGRRLYFRCYDCAFAQITGPEQLVTIEQSPLPAALDQAVIDAAPRALRPAFIEHAPSLEGRPATLLMTLFDEKGAPGFDVPLSFNASLMGGKQNHSPEWAAGSAIDVGDLLQLLCILKRRSLDGKSLDALLLSADDGPFDLAGTIKLLVAYGANPNARSQDDRKTPLMLHIGNALAIKALLALGADPWLQSNSGMTALAMVKKAEQFSSTLSLACSEELLVSAMSAKPVNR